jgi:hypothetical protein
MPALTSGTVPGLREILDVDPCGFLEPVVNAAAELVAREEWEEVNRLLGWCVEAFGPEFELTKSASHAARVLHHYPAAVREFGGQQAFRRGSFAILGKHILSGSRSGFRRWCWVGRAYCLDVLGFARNCCLDAESSRTAANLVDRAKAAPPATEDAGPLIFLTERLATRHLTPAEREHLSRRLEARLALLSDLTAERERKLAERDTLKAELARTQQKTRSGRVLGFPSTLSDQIRILRQHCADAEWQFAHEESFGKCASIGNYLAGEFRREAGDGGLLLRTLTRQLEAVVLHSSKELSED